MNMIGELFINKREVNSLFDEQLLSAYSMIY